mmetsp:Transcript_5004/g.9522  ORF Transcript_5004/g.9522 Transcript_5004/m.9522 type:complete len:795 (-) Transcript_5004:181-2565(-)
MTGSDDEGDDTTPLPTIMRRTSTGGADPLLKALKQSFSKPESPEDFNSLHKRRERVYMWHRRWAGPTYTMMKKQIERTPGLDITVADLDLLPWGAGQRLNNAEYHKLQRQAFLGEAKVKRQQSLSKDDQAAMEAIAAQLRAEQAEKAEQKAKAEEKARLEAQEKARIKAEEAKKRADEEAARRKKAEQEALEAEQERQRLAAAQAAEEQRRRAEEAAEKAARERMHQRRKQAPAVTKGNSRIERAYCWYDKLHQPTREQMLKAVEFTEGMDLTVDAIHELPWTADGTFLEYPRLHELLEKVTGKELALKEEEEEAKGQIALSSTAVRQKEKVGRIGLSSISPLVSPTKASWDRNKSDFTPRSSKGTFHLSADQRKSLLASFSGEDEKMKRKAFGWYLTFGRPTKTVMQQILTHARGVSVSVDDLDLLPWDENGELFVQEHKIVLPSEDEEKLRRQVARRKREDEARAEEAAEFEEWKQTEQTPAPAVPPEHVRSGNVATAYRWFKKLGEPTKENFLAALSETKGIPVTPEQVESLPWIKEDRALDHEHLTELLQQEEENAATSATENMEPPIDPAILAAILKAYQEYQALGIPKYVTFTTLIDETTGLKSTKDDVSLLPWDEGRIMVDEEQIGELQRRLEEYMALQNVQEAAKRKRAEERRKRREALARKAQMEKDEQRRQKEEKAALEEEEAKKKEGQTNIILVERMSLRELDLKRHKGDKKSWEESRTLKAYAWYTRMSGPNKKQLKRIVASMKECDVVPDDIDLLPWSASGGWVDHVKIEELSAKRKDLVY